MNLTILDDNETDIGALQRENKKMFSKLSAINQEYSLLSDDINQVYDLMFNEERDDGPREKLTKIKTLLEEINKNPIKRWIFRSWCNK